LSIIAVSPDKPSDKKDIYIYFVDVEPIKIDIEEPKYKDVMGLGGPNEDIYTPWPDLGPR